MLLNDETREEVKQMLSGLKDPVELLVFTQSIECMYCEEMRSVMQEVAELSEKITVTVYDFVKDKEIAEKYGIDKLPAVAVIGREDYGIRFFGIPAGYEFMSFLEAVKLVSTGETSIPNEIKAFLKDLEEEVHLQVFVSPTCPYCPAAVVLAHQMAYTGSRVKADMVEITEFPHLVNKYGVQGVPRTVVNEQFFIEGSVPDHTLTAKIKEALGR